MATMIPRFCVVQWMGHVVVKPTESKFGIIDFEGTVLCEVKIAFSFALERTTTGMIRWVLSSWTHLLGAGRTGGKFALLLLKNSIRSYWIYAKSHSLTSKCIFMPMTWPRFSLLN